MFSVRNTTVFHLLTCPPALRASAFQGHCCSCYEVTVRGAGAGYWTGHKSITGAHRQKRQPLTRLPGNNLELPNSLTVMFWSVGGDWIND